MQNSNNHPVVFFEIGGKDRAKIIAFYKEVFGWEHNREGIISPGEHEGIAGHIQSLGHEPHRYVLVYIQVPDIPAYLQKVVDAGGQNMVGPIELPDGRSFAWVKDIDGNIIGLLTPKK